MGEWISVKDRLPEKQPDGFKTYLVASWSHIRKLYCVNPMDWHNENFQDSCGDPISFDDGYWEITHWMPLPEPPNET